MGVGGEVVDRAKALATHVALEVGTGLKHVDELAVGRAIEAGHLLKNALLESVEGISILFEDIPFDMGRGSIVPVALIPMDENMVDTWLRCDNERAVTSRDGSHKGCGLARPDGAD